MGPHYHTMCEKRGNRGRKVSESESESQGAERETERKEGSNRERKRAGAKRGRRSRRRERKYVDETGQNGHQMRPVVTPLAFHTLGRVCRTGDAEGGRKRSAV
eukprot:362209-Chlamydomonas_euryale.AAC.1